MFTTYNKINLLQSKGLKFNSDFSLKRSPSAGYSKMIIRRGNHNNSLEKHSNKSFDYSTIKKQIDVRKLTSYKSTNNVFKTENNNSPSFYDINNSNNNYNFNNNKTPSYYGSQLKERLIQDLRNNFSQDKIQKKKMLNVNVNINLNQNYSLLNNNNNNSNLNNLNNFSNLNNNLNNLTNNNNLNNNNSFNNNPILTNNNILNNKSIFQLTDNQSHSNIFQNKNFFDRDHPTKLYTNPNKIIHRRNDSHHNFLSNLTNSNIKNSILNTDNNNLIQSQQNTQNIKITEIQNNQKLNEQYYELQIKLEKLIKENKTHSKSRNYNSIKMIFEEGIKLFNDEIQKNFLKIILVKYHELVIAYSTENKNLRQSSEHLQNQYLNLDKNFIELKKNLNDKEKEIEKYKKDLQDMKNKSFSEIINNSQITFCGKEEIKDNSLLQSKNSLLQSKNSLLQSKIDNKNNNLTQSKSFDIIFSNRHQRFVNIVNRNNLDDLDALYFNDKVDERKTENSINNMKKIPLLKFNFIK